MTEKEIREQAMAANPEPQYATVNGEQVEISGEAYRQMIDDYVAARLVQLEHEAEQAAKEAVKASALAKLEALGLTEAEAAAIAGL